MSKHKDKDRERSRDDRRSRDRERSRDRDRKRRSRSRSKDRHKRSKDSKRSKEKSSRRDRSRSRERRRSRSRDYRRSRSKSRSHHRRSPTPPRNDAPIITSEKMKHFISATLSGISNQSTSAVLTAPPLMAQVVEPVRTDFSNLFGTATTNVFQQSMAPNASALAIAAAKAKDLLKSKNLSEILNVEKNGSSVTSNGNESSQEASAFRAAMENENSETGDTSNSANDRKRKKKSRWATSNDSSLIPGMPTILPSNLNAHQQEAYLVQLQIEEISRKLRTGDLGIAQNPEERSPSPEPIYSSDGKRLNTREFRTRKKLEEQRHMLIQRMQCMNPDFKPPADYKPPVTRVSDKVLIPQEEHPDINFVGLLIGPRGNTLKAMEKDTGAKIIIRGKGSVKEGKVGRKDGQPLPGEDEPLHAFITASNLESVKKAVDKIKDVIKQGIEVPEGHNDLRRMQLRELAQLNGTLRENDNNRCNNCGSTEHKTWLCPDKPNVTNNIVCSACGGAGHIMKDCKQKRPGMGGIEGSNNQAKIDEEYLSLMAELGEVPPEALQQQQQQQQQQKPPEQPVAPPPKPYSIFDNPRNQFDNNRNQTPRAPLHAPPPSQPPPPWQQPLSAPPPVMPHHPMGQYPPPPMSWNANPPLPPGVSPFESASVPPPPPGTDHGLSPPGTFGFDDTFGKKPALNSWSLPPPGNNYGGWNPPLPPGPPAQFSNFVAPPPPPE